MTAPDTTTAATVRAGWFGKLPALGDFGTRRLPPAMVARCDAWLSAGLATSRQQLGAHWLDTYLTAPIWRFAWAPGLAGPAGWLGVLMPSVDRVGRYFPLLLAAPCGLDSLAGLAPQAADAWLDRLAQIAQGSLDPATRLDDLEAALDALPLPLPAMPVSLDAADEAGSVGVRAAAGTPLSPLLRALALRQLLQPTLAQPHSLWWSGASPDGPSALHRTADLPAAADFAALLDGRW